MRVLFNLLPARGARTGVGHYTRCLYDALVQEAAAETTPFPAPWMQKLGEEARRTLADLQRILDRWQKPSVSRALGPFGALGRWFAHQGWELARRAAERHQTRLFHGRSHDVYHEPNFVPLPSSLPTVTTIHDLSPLVNSAWHPADRVRWFEAGLDRTLTQSACIIAVTEFVRREVIANLGVPPDRVVAVHNGIHPGLGPLPADVVAKGLRRLHLPPRFLLYLGTIEPRKNILRLMQVYCSLPESLRVRCPLVLAGAWGWNVEREWEFFLSEARPRGVLHLGYVRDEDLAILYNGARALVYPSFYEGFGLPTVEMMACGGAVLTSTAGALKEVVGGQAELIPAEDGLGWRDALVRILTDDDWLAELRRGSVEMAARYSWARSANETMAVYHKVAGREDTGDCGLRIEHCRVHIADGRSTIPNRQSAIRNPQSRAA